MVDLEELQLEIEGKLLSLSSTELTGLGKGLAKPIISRKVQQSFIKS